MDARVRLFEGGRERNEDVREERERNKTRTRKEGSAGSILLEQPIGATKVETDDGNA